MVESNLIDLSVDGGDLPVKLAPVPIHVPAHKLFESPQIEVVDHGERCPTA
jgi:hypothetical protein